MIPIVAVHKGKGRERHILKLMMKNMPYQKYLRLLQEHHLSQYLYSFQVIKD